MQELDQFINNYLYSCYQKVMNDELICIRERKAAKEYVKRNVSKEDTKYAEIHNKMQEPVLSSETNDQEFLENMFCRYYSFGRSIHQAHQTAFLSFVRKYHLMDKYKERQALDYHALSSDELEFIYEAYDKIGNQESLYLEKMGFLDMSFPYFQSIAKKVKVFKFLYPNHKVSMRILPKDCYKTVIKYFKDNALDCMGLEQFIDVDKKFQKDYIKAQIVKVLYPNQPVLYSALPKRNITYILQEYGKDHNLSNTDQLQETFPMVSFPEELINKIHLYKDMFPNTIISSKIFSVSLTYMAINYILEDHSYEEITQMLTKTGKTATSLRKRIGDYLIANHYEDEQYEIQRAKIKEKLDQYMQQRHKINEGKKEEQKRKEYQALQKQASLLIRDFIASGMSRREYTQMHNNATLFDKCQNIVRDTDPKLYGEYIDITTGVRNANYAVLSKLAYAIIEKVNRPIKLPDGKTRPYDVLDFYEERINNFQALWDVVSHLDPVDRKQLQYFKSFVTKNKLLKEPYYFSKNKIMEEKVVIHVAFDARGNIIEGSGHVVTEAEKLSIMDYLVQHKIPLNDITYQAAFKRFRTNTLFDNKNDHKVNRKTFT